MESEQFEEVTRGMNFILAPDIFQETMDRLNEIGPTPLIKKRKQSDQTLPFFRVSLTILTRTLSASSHINAKEDQA